MSKSKKTKRIFKNHPTKAELEGYAAYSIAQNLLPHQRLEFAKAMAGGVGAGEELSYAQSLAKKARNAWTDEDEKLSVTKRNRLLDLVSKSKLRYGRNRITAAKSVTFIKDEREREVVQEMLLVAIIDKFIGFAEEEDFLTKEQHKELEAHFRNMVELALFYRGEQDVQAILSRMPSNVIVESAGEERIEEIFNLSDTCVEEYQNGIIAEEATKHLDRWRQKFVTYILLMRIIASLFHILVPDGLTQEQFDEIYGYIKHLTSRYMEYHSLKPVSIAS